MKKVIGGFGAVSGATYPLRALGVFWQNPSLWGYIVIPIVLNCLIAIAIYSGLFFFGWELIDNFQTDFRDRDFSKHPFIAPCQVR